MPKWNELTPEQQQQYFKMFSERNLFDRSTADYGQNFGTIQNFLRNALHTSVLPGKELYRQQGKAQIGSQVTSALNSMQESAATRGMSGSGAAQGAAANIFAGGARAGGELEANLAQTETDYLTKMKLNAISGLLGLNQQELGANQQDFANKFGIMNFWEGRRQFDENQRLQAFLGQEASPDPWMQILGSLISAGGQIGGAAVLASDRRLKKNIKQIGKTKLGIPIVEFSYIGEDERRTGVIAQDVEEVIPDAVIELNGIKYVDYSKVR